MITAADVRAGDQFAHYATVYGTTAALVGKQFNAVYLFDIESGEQIQRVTRTDFGVTEIRPGIGKSIGESTLILHGGSIAEWIPIGVDFRSGQGTLPN